MRNAIRLNDALNKISFRIVVSVLMYSLMIDAVAAKTADESVTSVEEAYANLGTTQTGNARAIEKVQSDKIDKNPCLLAKQLKTDFFIRADYEGVIAANRSKNTDWKGSYDPLSMECISCHDGTVARPVSSRMSFRSEHFDKGIATISGSHPIGMDYGKFNMNKEYVPSELLPANMVLMGGKVGCVTCHNLLSSNNLYLVVDNAGSELCFSCHNK